MDWHLNAVCWTEKEGGGAGFGKSIEKIRQMWLDIDSKVGMH